ncbi:unnamed protein product [Hymenolepis diminuta]|uniref:Uncharacterized protein n=1 Tax=Hymenolepis diminuta TaxID=6216 RepID=A0A564Y4Y4_HYMDI|nr:unnamed protein product [Hymenolepis diminuta]
MLEDILLTELVAIADQFNHHSNELLHYENCIDRRLTLSSKGSENIKFLFYLTPTYPCGGGKMYVYRDSVRLIRHRVHFKSLSQIIVVIMGFLAERSGKPMPYFASKFSPNTFAEYVKNHPDIPSIAFI